MRQSQTQSDLKCREASSRLIDAEERLKYAQQRLKEAELERDLVLAERNNALQANDVTAAQVQAELNSLRECFARLKVERDGLLGEMDEQEVRERERRAAVEGLTEELRRMERQLLQREGEQAEQIRALEGKNGALIEDVKYLRQENERLKQRQRSLEQT